MYILVLIDSVTIYHWRWRQPQTIILDFDLGPGQAMHRPNLEASPYIAGTAVQTTRVEFTLN